MKLVTFRHDSSGRDARAGVLQGDRILSAGRLLGAPDEITVVDIIADDLKLERLSIEVGKFAGAHATTPLVPTELAVPAWECTLIAPVPHPPSIRDFFAFEQHVAAGYRPRGRDIPAAWYEIPVFYFGHTGNILGPDQAVQRPAGVKELDFELELAVIIGRPGRDVPSASAWQHVAGFTIMNDWSARDVQRQEMSLGLGPAKGKDFATSLGPVLLTRDEVADQIEGERITLTMIARINGEEAGRDTSNSMHWTFPAMIERASRGADLRPGDVIGSGTCGCGCIFEVGVDTHPWLEPGDEIELEIERIGRLRSVVA